MLGTYLRAFFICAVGGGLVMDCGGNVARKIPASGSGGSTATGTGGSTTGAAGSATGSGGDVDVTGAAGDSSGAAGSATGAAGDTSAVDAAAAGTSGDNSDAAGSTTGAAGDTGAAGAPAVDNSLLLTLPVAVTDNWYPSGWDGDPYTVSTFALSPPIVITDMSTATTGPCAHRVAGALGACFKVTYTPVMQPDAGAPGHASVALIPNYPIVQGDPNSGKPDFDDPTQAPRVPAGAMRAAVQVAGDVGGEAVTFNLGSASDTFNMQFTGTTLTTSWQQLTVGIQPGYSHVFSPFGWGSASTTPVTFYYDDVRIDATAP
jgi:hypothetical protein